MFGYAVVHVLGEVLGTEDIATVDRHDDGEVKRSEWVVRGS